MDRSQPEQGHDDYQELLGAYVLGTLTEAEIEDLEQHIVSCASCAAEVRALRATAMQLALVPEAIDPPARLRSAIYDAARREPRPIRASAAAGSAPPSVPPHTIGEAYPNWLPWAIAAALLVIAVGLLTWNLQLRQDQTRNEVRTIALVNPATESELGQVRYLTGQGVFVIQPGELPPLSEGQVYEIWLILGETPQPAGVFTDAAARQAVAANLVDVSAIAITIEPGPLGSAQPTSDPIAVAPVSRDAGE